MVEFVSQNNSAGKLGTLRIRYYKFLNYGEKINLKLETNIGNFENDFYLFESPLRLRYVGFSDDLRKIYLFVQNKNHLILFIIPSSFKIFPTS